MLAIGTQTSTDKVRIINFDTDTVLELEEVSTEGARGIDWNYAGELLAVADNDGVVSLFNVNGQLIRQIKHDNTKSITAVDWHPEQNTFITVGDKIRIFDSNGLLLNTILHRKDATLLLSVAWHPSGDFFATGDYGDTSTNYPPLLQFWTAQGELLKSVDKSKGEYRTLQWNAKGDKLATASDALRIWDQEGNLLAKGKSESYLWGLSWKKTGNRIVTSSASQNVVIWNKKAKKLKTKQQ